MWWLALLQPASAIAVALYQVDVDQRHVTIRRLRQRRCIRAMKVAKSAASAAHATPCGQLLHQHFATAGARIGYEHP